MGTFLTVLAAAVVVALISLVIVPFWVSAVILLAGFALAAYLAAGARTTGTLQERSGPDAGGDAPGDTTANTPPVQTIPAAESEVSANPRRNA